MTVLLATICLNEMEFLPKLYRQHSRWPGLTRWVFVEAADQIYAETNPDLVSADGLSVDGTSQFLQNLAVRDPKVVHIQHGISRHEDRSQGKIAARNRYMEIADEVKPEFLIVVDADEFYTHRDQARLPSEMNRHPAGLGYVLTHREIWCPPSMRHGDLFTMEVTGGSWGVRYCRCWRWSEGLRYVQDHNTPSLKDGSLMIGAKRRPAIAFDKNPSKPQMIHLGYASKKSTRQAKNRYYERRGEASDPRRKWYTECRRAWESWNPGDSLPHGGKVARYTGPVPEVFAVPNPSITRSHGNYLEYRFAPGKTCEIVDLYVNRAHRRKGEAAYMLKELKNLCKDKAQAIYAFTRASNVAAQAFYQNQGFVGQPVPGLYSGEDAVLYVLTLH